MAKSKVKKKKGSVTKVKEEKTLVKSSKTPFKHKKSMDKGHHKSLQKDKKAKGGADDKRGKKTKGPGGWNDVPIEEDCLVGEDMENLISLEVLTDYHIVKTEDGLTHIVTKQEDQEKEVPLVPAVEKKKLKTKKAKDVKKPAIPDVSDEDDDDDDEGEMEEEAQEEPEHDQSTRTEVVVKVKTVENQKKRKLKDSKEAKTLKKKRAVLDKAAEPLVEEDDNEGEDMGEWVKAGVSDVVRKALGEAGFFKPTTIQALTLPSSLLGKKDIVGTAETGSGKTLAFAIPIIQGILRHIDKDQDESSSLSALILTPTRELAVQVKKHFDVAAKFTPVRSMVLVGGLAAQKQSRLLKQRPQVVIATPGRLWELVKEGEAHLASLQKIRFLAVDETDRMVEPGHFEELQSILEVVNSDEEWKAKRQNFVFSATLAFTHEPPKRLQTKTKKKKKAKWPTKMESKEKLSAIMDAIGVRPHPKVVDITSSKGTCETLEETQINCPASKKDYYLYYFLSKHPGRTIVFCNSINTVRRLTNLCFLLRVGQVLPLHSEMNQKMRLKNLDRFTGNERGVLIATDVAARGLDIADIQHVVHYEVPKTAESYIHRSGRTARAFKGGIAVVLVEPADVIRLKNIFKSLNRDPDKPLPPFPIEGKLFTALKAIVDEADKVEKFEHTVRKKLADLNWMEKAKKDMELASSSDDEEDKKAGDFDGNDDSGSGAQRHKRNLLQAKKKLEGYKRSLNKLLEENNVIKS